MTVVAGFDDPFSVLLTDDLADMVWPHDHVPIPADPARPQCAQLRARLNDGPGSAPTRWRICQPHQAAGRA
jgi:hypothetical protein